MENTVQDCAIRVQIMYIYLLRVVFVCIYYLSLACTMMNDITMMVMTDDRKRVCGTIESAQNLVRFRSIKCNMTI